jgi:acyl-CoA synthetase (AMP-forming)/AMP-acid ligase II
MQKLLSALYGHAAAAPLRPALLFIKGTTYQQFSYEDLLCETERWANLFAASWLEPGGVIAIVLNHRIEMYPAYLGAMRAGFIPTFLPYPTPKQDPDLYWSAQAELFERVRPTCVVTYENVRARVADLASGFGFALIDVDALPEASGVALPPLEMVEADDRIALLQHSSGTTGAKKGVALTYAAIREQALSHFAALGGSSEDKTISWLPLYHDMGLLAAFLIPVATGSSIISIDAFEWLARPAMFFELIERYRATQTWLPNFALNHLVRTHDPAKTYDLSSLRSLVSSSEPCKPATFESFYATFGPHGIARETLRCSYAMAEAVFACTLTATETAPRTLAIDAEALATRNIAARASDRAAEYLSCGRPLAGLELRIAAGAGENVGEIQIRGRFVFEGYFRNPEATAESFADGWYKTGDLGFLYDGELYVCGRRKEMLIVHGQNFYAHDIEMLIDSVPGIKPGRIVVFGRYDESTASEEAVVLAESAAESEDERAALASRIRSVVFSNLGLQVRSVEIRPIGELVKTTSGKMSRSDNAKRYEEANAAATAAIPT